MSLKLVGVFLLAISALGAVTPPHSRRSLEPSRQLCGVGSSSIQLGKRQQKPEVATLDYSIIKKRANIPVDVWFHVIRKDDTNAGGNIPKSRLDEQWTVLRNHMATLGFDLKLVGTTDNLKPDWFNFYEGNHNMMRALQKGNFRTLNVYFLAMDKGGTTMPFANDEEGTTDEFPIPATPTELQKVRNGIYINHNTVPGGADYSDLGWTMGKTAVHEAGHWFGLHHPYNGAPPYGSCHDENNPNSAIGGDWVGDTPQMYFNQNYCKDDPRYIAKREDWLTNLGLDIDDTCEFIEGLDPHENLMGVFSDRCKDPAFTAGQKARAQAIWARTRANFPTIVW